MLSTGFCTMVYSKNITLLRSKPPSPTAKVIDNTDVCINNADVYIDNTVVYNLSYARLQVLQ